MDTTKPRVPSLLQPQTAVYSAIVRFRRFLTLFVEAAAAESEHSTEALADWVHNLQTLRDSFSIVTAVRGYVWSEAAGIARPLESFCDQFESRMGVISQRLRNTQIRDCEAPQFVRMQLVQSLAEFAAVVDSSIQRSVSGMPASEIPEGSEDVIVDFWNRCGSNAWAPAFEQTMSWERAELQVAWEDGDELAVCRMLRRTRLVHYAWGAVMPQQWKSSRDKTILALHQKSIERISNDLCLANVRQAITLLVKDNRDSFDRGSTFSRTLIREVS